MYHLRIHCSTTQFDGAWWKLFMYSRRHRDYNRDLHIYAWGLMHLEILLKSVFPLLKERSTPCYVKMSGATVNCLLTRSYLAHGYHYYFTTRWHFRLAPEWRISYHDIIFMPGITTRGRTGLVAFRNGRSSTVRVTMAIGHFQFDVLRTNSLWCGGCCAASASCTYAMLCAAYNWLGCPVWNVNPSLC